MAALARFGRRLQGAARSRSAAGPPLVVCIDVEPDPRLPDRYNPTRWRGFERFMAELPSLRERLKAAGGSAPHFTWFLRMDPQIADTWGSPTWVHDEYGEHLAALERDGDELALHTHAWRWDDAAGDWVACRGDPEWVGRCTNMAFDAFEATVGRPCRAYRGGDRHLSPELLSLLVARGVEVDLTIEPGLAPEGGLGDGEQARGDTPDYRNAPTEPYRPRSLTEFLSTDPDGEGPVMVPLLSAEDEDGHRSPLYLWTEPAIFAARLDRVLEQAVPAALAFGIRTDLPLIPEWPWFIENAEYLARHPRLPRSRFATASEAAAALRL